MRIIGGPRNGQVITITEPQSGTEVQIPGMILEYAFTTPGSVQIKMSADLEPRPSVRGLVERYRCQDGAWHYIPPAGIEEFMASPPVVME